MAKRYSYSPDRLDLLRDEQRRLAELVCVPPHGRGYRPCVGDLLVTLDVQYVGETAFVAADLMRWPDKPVVTLVQTRPVSFPYISQYFAFREGPLLLNMIEWVVQETGETADVLLIDGHGRAHPRRFGIACFVGLETGVPTIGCGKEPLLRFARGQMNQARGSTWPLLREDDELGEAPLGFAVVTQDGVRPLFVSPGHLVAADTAVEMVLTLASRYRQPEPIRRADQAARRASKQ